MVAGTLRLLVLDRTANDLADPFARRQLGHVIASDGVSR
jgi:hypothetical protein